MAYFLDNYPVSSESADLLLTEEQKKYCRIVYKIDEEGGAVFEELWDPDAEYSDEYVIVPITSTGFTVTLLDPNNFFAPVKSFANVLGSNEDHKIGGQWWIDLWANNANGGRRTDTCSTDGKFYTGDGTTESKLSNITVPIKNEYTGKWEDFVQCASCGGSIVGGHIIVNAKEAVRVPQNGLVYIIPICNKHNIAFTAGHEWGAGFYMKLKRKIDAIRLKGYLTKVKEYLEEFKDEVQHE